MREAVSKLEVVPQLLLNDAVTIPQITIPQVPIIKGDAKSVSIAAASIVAKVTRDRMMEEYDKVFPEYGFASNKGYVLPIILRHWKNTEKPRSTERPLLHISYKQLQKGYYPSVHSNTLSDAQ